MIFTCSRISSSDSSEFSKPCISVSVCNISVLVLLNEVNSNFFSRINARFPVIVCSMAAILSALLLAHSFLLFSSFSICSVSIAIRPSTPESSNSASRNLVSIGAMSSDTFSIASSTTIPLLKRLIISFFSLSEQDRKSSYLCFESTKLLKSSSRVMPSFSKIYFP